MFDWLMNTGSGNFFIVVIVFGVALDTALKLILAVLKIIPTVIARLNDD